MPFIVTDPIITSGADLKSWLYDKKNWCARIIALRTAMRVAPLAADQGVRHTHRPSAETVKAIFRSLLCGYGVEKFEAIGRDRFHRTMALRSGQYLDNQIATHYSKEAIEYRAMVEAAGSASPESASEASRVHAARSRKAAQACSAAMTCFDEENRAENGCVRAVQIAAAAAVGQEDEVWKAVSLDCQALKQVDSRLEFLVMPLWPGGSGPFEDVYRRATGWYSDHAMHGGVLSRWHRSRMAGEPLAFRGMHEKLEFQFFQKIDRTNNDWWNRTPSSVYPDIAAWIDALTQAKTRHDFFISYATPEEPIAKDVAEVLDDLGHTYVVQYRDFAQRNFVNAMNEGLAASERLIPLLSKGYIRSDHCNAEWDYFYNLDPSSEDRKIVPFLLEPTDLRPLMRQIVYKDLSGLGKAERKQAIREWIEYAPPTLTRPWVEEVLKSTLSPQLVSNASNGIDIEPNAEFDQPEHPAELQRALRELRGMLDFVREDAANLSRSMQRAISRYDDELSEYGVESSWGLLDRYIAILSDGIASMSSVEFSAGQKQALEELIAAHNACMTALKNADLRMRDLSAIPIDAMDAEAIKDLVEKAEAFFSELSDLGVTSDRLDDHIENVVEEGKNHAFEAGAADAANRPREARRRYLLYIGGLGLSGLGAAGSIASISSTPAGQAALGYGQQLVDAFFRLVGL